MIREEVIKEWQELKSKFFQLSDFRRMVIERLSVYAKPHEIKDLNIIKWQIGDGPIMKEVE